MMSWVRISFTKSEAQSLIEQLSQRSNFILESALIEQLVKDLAAESGKVRPIELQVVGAQLQAEDITTLGEYRQFGTKEELVKRYLAEVVGDCGEENQQVAEVLLYLLTDEKERRLLKTRTELNQELTELIPLFTPSSPHHPRTSSRFANTSSSPHLITSSSPHPLTPLDLVLEILVTSGLLFLVPDTPDDRYQLVHDYLVPFVRQQQPKIQEVIAQLHQEREQRQRLERNIEQVRGELSLVQGEKERVEGEVEQAQRTRERLEKENQKVSRRVKVGSAVLALTLVSAGVGLAWIGKEANEAQQQVETAQQQIDTAQKKADKAQEQATEAQQRETIAQEEVNDAQKRVSEIQKRETEAQKEVETAQQQLKEVKKQASEAEQNVKAAEQQLATAQQQATEAQQQVGEAEQRISQANQQVQLAERREQEAKQKEESAQAKVREAEEQLERAETATEKANITLAQAEAEREEALQGTELERRGTQAIRQFNYEQIPALLTAMQAGKELKTLVKNRPLKDYPASSPISALQQILNQIQEKNQLRHESTVWSVSFSPDGEKLASASSDSTVRLWDMQGKELGVLKGHESTVLSVSFSPDGEKLASASDDGTVRLWDLQGKELGVLKGHEGSVYSVSFSPDGEKLASASLDNTVRLWRVETLDELLVRGCQWLGDYLRVNGTEEEREVCEGVMG